MAPTGREAVALQARLLPGSSPPFVNSPPVVPPLRANRSNHRFFSGRQTWRNGSRYCLRPIGIWSAPRNDSGTCGSQHMLHDCYKKLLKILQPLCQHVRTRRQLFRLTAIGASSIPLLLLARNSASAQTAANSTYTGTSTVPIDEGDKHFDSLGRSSGAGTANWRLSSGACRS